MAAAKKSPAKSATKSPAKKASKAVREPKLESPKGPIESVATYYTLGRSGLKVSPLCLGTMTFGKEFGWGNTERESEVIFDRYLDAGGNFLDTANFYTEGTSEKYLGRFLKKRRNRDRVVLATKYTLGMYPGDPNGGGNSRKTMMEALDASLRRLQTDYVDIYWMHMHDLQTSAEEVMRGLDDLVRAGKIRYIGLSDVPAWYATKSAMLAQWRDYAPVIAMQLEYSLITREIELEYIPLAKEFGMGITPWSPLAGGLLSGKYTRENKGKFGGKGRLTFNADSPSARLKSERNWRIVDELLAVSNELGLAPAQVALNWITKRPGIVSTIIGATSLDQLNDNLHSLEFDLPAELSARLEAASSFDKGFPYEFLQPGSFVHQRILAGARVEKLPPWY